MPIAAARLVLGITLLVLTTLASAREITVFAAVSLSDCFKEIVTAYKAQQPDTTIWLNTGASGTLLHQMENGATTDIFASADVATMTSATQAGLVQADDVQIFAENRLVVIVPANATVRPASLDELATGTLRRIAMGNPATVPAGVYARGALTARGLWPSLQPRLILTENVRQALTYVAQGEVDAGLVYQTDARTASSRVAVAFTVNGPDPIHYAIAPTKASRKAAETTAFIGFIRSAAGQRILQKHGFLLPR